jgi:hypothetical protein
MPSPSPHVRALGGVSCSGAVLIDLTACHRRTGPRSTSTQVACWPRTTRRSKRPCARARTPGCRRSRSRRRRASCCTCWRRRSGRGRSSSSGRSAATARSGWPGPFPPMVAWSPWRRSPATPRSRARTSPARASATSSTYASAPPSTSLIVSDNVVRFNRVEVDEKHLANAATGEVRADQLPRPPTPKTAMRASSSLPWHCDGVWPVDTSLK